MRLPPRAGRSWRRVLVLLVLLLATAGTGIAQRAPARVEAYVSADSVKIGERFTLTLVAEHQFSTEVLFPPAGAGPVLFGDLEVIRRGPVQNRYLGRASPGTRRDSVTYEVVTFALDSARVPSLPVRVVAGEDTLLADSPPLRVPVVSVVGPDATGLRDLAPLATFPAPIWPWVLLGLSALLVAAGLFYLWRQRTTDGPEEAVAPTAEPEVTPYETAIQRLRALEQARAYHDPDAVKLFYVELSNVLRIYLARRLGVRALERTTGELVRTLDHRSAVPERAVGRVQAVLELADLAKFASTRPSPADSQKALQETKTALDVIEDALRPAAPEARSTTAAPQDATPAP